MFGFFNKGPSQQPGHDTSAKTEVAETAPGTRITYKKDLIKKYKSDHRELLSLYAAVNKSYEHSKFDEVLKHLHQMQDALRAHLLDEELNFYIYLKHCYDIDTESLSLITDYKKSMKEIGLAAFTFLKKYTAMGQAIAEDEQFLQEFHIIGQALGRRIHAEERYLYPLYRHPGEFQKN